MKKTISLVLVAAMLLCTFAIAPVATTAATLDEHNVAIEAVRFDGQVDFYENSGDLTSMDFYDPVTIVDGNSGDVLDINGSLDDAAWANAPLYTISSEYAANNAGQQANKNTKFETASAENSYFFYALDSNRKSMAPEKLEYTIRFMWDESYLYLGVEVADYDGHRNTGTAGNGTNWDGDAFQFRVDPNGPNAIVNGTGYDASVDSFPFQGEPGETDNTHDCTFPWSNDYTTYTGYGQETYSTLGNFVFSFTAGGGYTDMCDAAKKYNPTVDPNDETKLIYSGIDISAYMGEVDYPAYATVVPVKETGAADGRQYTTTYEIALPWELVAIDGQDLVIEDGKELGFSSVLFNTSRAVAANDPREGVNYNSWLEWGSGICGSRTEHDPQTCGGSNCLTLVGETSEALCEHTFAESTCIDPETCTKCGYQRGFVAGHEYVYSNATLPTTSTDGYIFAECSVCGDTFDKNIPSRDLADYRKFTTSNTQNELMNSGFTDGYVVQWEVLDEEGKRADTANGETPVYIYNDDGSAKCAFDTDTFGYSVLDMSIEGQTGTYFAGDSIPESFTHKFDVYFTDLDGYKDADEETYNYIFGQWFGGGITGGVVDYAAGLVEVEDQFYWAIYPSAYTTIRTYEELEAVALCIQPATEKQLDLNKWHEFVFMLDDDTDTAMLFWDDQLVAAASDYHFDTPGRSTVPPIFRSMGIGYYMKDIHYGSTAYAAEYVKPADSYTLTLNGEAAEYAVGEEITLAAEFYIDVTTGVAYRFKQWTGDVAAAGIDAAVASQTFNMPAESISLTAEYIAIGDIVADGAIDARDLNLMSRMASGSYTISDSADLNGDGNLNGVDVNLMRRYTLNTWTPNK